MKKFLSMLLTLVMIMAFAAPIGTINAAAISERDMEYLDRGVVAVRNGNSVFVSWRLLVSDDPYVGFNVYRTTDGVTVKLNSEPLYGGTNFTDTTANLSKDNTYFVTTVLRGVERDTDGNYTIAANAGSQYITIPINQGGTIHFVWVGDFNGDGKYDYLLDRLWGETQKLEAYLHDGTYLWTIDLGYNSTNTNNIEPGASTIDVGMWDGATVYDIDCDGYAEVLLRVADGVVYGNGKVHSNSTTNGQDIAVINGMTGALEASAPVPTDMISAGPKACMMAVGYLDGVNPSLVCWLKNRNDDKTFNSYMVAYGYKNGKFVQRWKYNNNKGYAEAHNIRIADVDYDGCDEVLHMGYALNGDGSLRYTVDKVVHGDRWYVGSFCNDNNNNEMMGYGIQQDNASGLLEYFYNASTGKLIWTNYAASGTADVARGNVGDVDPNYDGFECWSFQGLYSMSGEQIHTDSLYPVIRLWWDGDLLSESYNDGKIEEWDYNNKWTNRVLTTWKVTDCTGSDRGAPMFYGDILGDWREEIVMTSSDYSKLVILSTVIPTDYRLDCLAQNPCYRNCMTGKGYYQSHMLDYFLGSDMEMPRTESIAMSDEIIDGAVYMIKNANSNLYLDVTNGTAADGTNVQQWGATYPGGAYNTWKLVDAGDGYYQIYSMLGDGNTYVLDVSGTKSANGTNIIIWTNKNNNGQYFKLEDNGDGTYGILTKVTSGASGLDVYDASSENGGNVVQWKYYGSDNQRWILEKVSDPVVIVEKTVEYEIVDNGNIVTSWSESGEYDIGEVLYDIPEGEFYYEYGGKAHILKSEEQYYAVADDGNDTLTVTYEVVSDNAVLADTFATVDIAAMNNAADMLFAGAAGVSDAPDTDADGEMTVTGGLNVGNPRVPLLTFNVPEDYEDGKAVKLNVYVAKVNHNFIQKTEGAMKLAVRKIDGDIQENAGYAAGDYACSENVVWSDNFMTIEANAKAVDQKVDVNDWLTFDVTEFVENAGDKITVALYAPTAGVYIVDRESAMQGGLYEGKAAYLEVVDGEKINTSGIEKVTKNGSLVQNSESFVVPCDATVKFYDSTGAFAVTNGSETYEFVNGVTESIDVAEGKYVPLSFDAEGIVYSTADFETLSYDAVVNGTIDMDVMPLEVTDNVIGITASNSNPTWYDQLNIVIGFRPDGTVKAYNGTALDSVDDISYEAGKVYHVHVETNVAEATFSAWITDANGTEYALATGYTYRASAPEASDMGKLTVLGGWNIGGEKLLVANIEFANKKIAKEVEYVITGEDGTVAQWSEYFDDCVAGSVLYEIPAGEYYYEHDGKAYVVRSEEQTYTVENDGIKTHTVEFELVYDNAVVADTFATVDGAESNNASEMLFVASAADSDADDVDADGNATVTGEGWNLGNPRIPLLTFNVPENYEEGMAVKLNVYVASAHTHLGKGNEMKIAAAGVDVTVDEGNGYYTADVANLDNLVWSDNAVGYTNNSATIDTWVSIDVTDFVQNAEDTVTIALYAPRAAVYVVDRESAMSGGSYEGLAAYLEVMEGETIITEGIEKATKNGSLVANAECFTVPLDAAVKFYNSTAYAVSDGNSLYTFTDGVTDAIEAVSGEYYAVEIIYSTEGFEALEYAPITNGTIDMLLMPYEVTDNVVGITASDSTPTWYDQFNIVVRFKPDGTMDAYNGTVIESYEDVTYEAGKTYRLHIETDIESATYSAWITDEDGNEYTLAQDYSYRASAPEANDLGKVTLIGGWEIGGEKFAAADIRFAE